MNVLIITGGRIDPCFANHFINKTEWGKVIAADSGLEYCRKEGVIPDLILGDFDSADPETFCAYQARYPSRIEKFPSRKDETDTELAIRKAVEAGADSITILGATGSRMDHVLGNIQLLKLAMDAGVECFLVDEHNRIRMTDKNLTLEKSCQYGDYVSLIPYTPAVEGLTLTGFAYEVADYTMTGGNARGVSNRIEAERATIAFSKGILLVIESLD